MPIAVPERTERPAKPQYRTLVKALDELADWTGHFLASCSKQEINESFKELNRAHTQARDLVERGRAAMAEKSRKRKEARNVPTTDYD